jgi:hypothetical protein
MESIARRVKPTGPAAEHADKQKVFFPLPGAHHRVTEVLRPYSG